MSFSYVLAESKLHDFEAQPEHASKHRVPKHFLLNKITR